MIFLLPPMGDSDKVRAGDWVYVIGNPFLLATDFVAECFLWHYFRSSSLPVSRRDAVGIHRLSADGCGD